MEEKQLNGDGIRSADSNTVLTVGIIGVAGRYGQWLKPRFERLGHTVIGSDLDDGRPSNTEVVERSDVVIFSVPIADAVNIIEKVIDHSRSDQLWMDITSVKDEPISTMLRSEADVIGLHPMCGPDLPSWKGQTVAICYARVRQERWKAFLRRFLDDTRATYYIVSPAEHDANMAYVQALPHALSMMMVGTFTHLGVNVSETWRYATPPYKLAFATVSRILDGNLDLYADIQISNRQHTLVVLKELQAQAKYLYDCVKTNNKEGIKSRLKEGLNHFKKDNVADGLNDFLQLARTMADFSSGNSKIIHCKQDKPGLLDLILQAIAKHGINLTALHSFKTPEYGGFSFHLGLESEPYSWSVQEAMCEIRNHRDLQDIVVIEDP